MKLTDGVVLLWLNAARCLESGVGVCWSFRAGHSSMESPTRSSSSCSSIPPTAVFDSRCRSPPFAQSFKCRAPQMIACSCKIHGLFLTHIAVPSATREARPHNFDAEHQRSIVFVLHILLRSAIRPCSPSTHSSHQPSPLPPVSPQTSLHPLALSPWHPTPNPPAAPTRRCSPSPFHRACSC